MDDNAGLFYVQDGELKEASGTYESIDGSVRPAYEVIRIIKGVPLFYGDHFERLQNTFSAIGGELAVGSDLLREYLKKLLIANRLSFCNVKVIVFETGGRQSVLAYICQSRYPTEEEANAGVRTGLLRLERDNPNAKILKKSYIEAVKSKIAEGGYYEVILTDSMGRVTEGSKSNAFFIKGNKIFTAPGDSVLKGVTRKYVFRACANAGYDVVEQFVHAGELAGTDGAFLSGTSIKVLPVAFIDDLQMPSARNPVIMAVRKEYDKLLDKYINENAGLN